MKKRLKSKVMLVSLIVLTCFIISCMSVSAITGKIGNGRMIINLEGGDSIDKSILVINDNNVSVNISMWAAGNLSSRIRLEQTNFMLKPGEQRKAGFTLSAGNKAGRDEGKINVQFKPMGVNESGVGLASQIILNVYDKGKLPGYNNSNNSTDDGSDDNPVENETDGKPGKIWEKISEEWKNMNNAAKEKISWVGDKINNNKAGLFLLLITIILVAGLIILRRIAKSKNKKKDEKIEEIKKTGEKGGETKKLKYNEGNK